MLQRRKFFTIALSGIRVRLKSGKNLLFLAQYNPVLHRQQDFHLVSHIAIGLGQKILLGMDHTPRYFQLFLKRYLTRPKFQKLLLRIFELKFLGKNLVGMVLR
jgi:hypothetical protein